MSTDVTKTKSPSSSKDKERKSKKDVASPSSTKSNGEKKEKKEKKSTHTRTDSSKSRDGSDSKKSKKDKKVGESALKSSESVSNASLTTDASSSNTSPSGSRGSSIKGMKLPEREEKKVEEKKVEEKAESNNKEGPITKDVCAGCHRSIMGDVCHAMNNKWHLYCFTCTTCKTSVSDEYYENDGKPYCKRDFNKLFGTTCSACKKEITGKKLKALEREWHPQCFVCHKCKRSFPDMEYYEREDKQPYCETCYDELEDAAAQ